MALRRIFGASKIDNIYIFFRSENQMRFFFSYKNTHITEFYTSEPITDILVSKLSGKKLKKKAAQPYQTNE